MLKPFKLFFVVVLIFIFISPAVQASESSPSGRWWKMPAVTNQLELTEGQIDDLENLYYGHKRKLINLKKDVESEQFELEILMEAEILDDEKAMEQHEMLEKARGNLAKERFGYFLEIRKVLGFEKFRKLVELRKQRQKKRRAPEKQ